MLSPLLHLSIAFAAGVFYCSVLVVLLAGLRRIRPALNDDTPFVSVIVAARNEERNLDRLLTSLTQQQYPHYEIVIADDRSTDETRSILERWRKQEKRVQCVHIDATPPGWSPKKYALTRAIRQARGEILCFTDADCVPPPGWLRGIVTRFDATVGVVAGYSPYDVGLLGDHTPSGFWNELYFSFVYYEELKAALWSAGAIGLNMAWLCTGRNLAYRRRVFDQVNGFESIKHSLSGDDDLFLQLVRRKTDWKIDYALDKSTFVPTAPPPNFSAFLRQRIRHFSAGRFFSLPMKLFFTAFHASNLLIVLSFILWLLVPKLSTLFAAVFAAKTVADFTFMTAGGARLGAVGLKPAFLLMELLYVLYNTIIGPLGFITQSKWKPEPGA